MASLKEKLFAAASATPALQALLGSDPFQWADEQLVQGWDLGTFGAVVAYQISAPRDYATTGRFSTYRVRMQFTVYGTGNDSENASAIVSALEDFFATFKAIEPSLTVYPNRILGDRDGGVAQTQPLTYTRTLDVSILNDENF
jgi:hypothetical protein